MTERSRPADPRKRFARRRTRRRLHTAGRVLIGVLVVALIGAGVWLVAFSPVLAADKVKVTGTDLLTVAEVEQVADVDLGTPLARLDVEAIAERVRTLVPVEKVEVSRSWPGTVSIAITERTAVAWIRTEGEVHGIDRFGADFRTFDAPPELIEVRVDTTDPRDRQQSLEGLGAVAAVLRDGAPELVAQIEFGQAQSQDSISFQLTDRRTVTWGSAEDSERKIDVLMALLGSVEASVYDVSAPGQPTTKA